ncbi:malate dehydrogenase [Flammeovirga kamogawensis]|uniref:Malate dehydrogenase n=1 Tax=Flammeovirga kamogawensis TaxID=373891 RepID=A0ABX8H3Z9_9BACT|nr:malate dehydrogenase [Flammeovirga kamogawensis]MBB6460328.1 malate dehydrogenase [Flammeovirga kamogawensis]QWG10137.1 hypothetical protein KM029_20865 [Flammeovirga kamogawensis]TRX65646.1 malate dehydrogenase [Flammeovirga kamogawensis]
MEFITNEKLVISGGGGMIGSNMIQTAMMMNLTPNITVYDPFLPGLEGAVKEMYHCGFEGFNLNYTTDIKEAFTDAKYIVSSGGAARKAGMTREDLLKGNVEIAAQLGKDIKAYCPDVKHVCIVFNPADITGLVTLIHSGLKPSQISTLAGLDSTRLQIALAQHFGIPQSDVKTPRTYGGHGEQMAVYSSSCTINGVRLDDLIGTDKLTLEEWDTIRKNVVQGGKNIIELRGRSSFQSPAYLSIRMIAAVMGGPSFQWPVGAYINTSQFPNILMALATELSKNGVKAEVPSGSEKENEELTKSYNHLIALRDEVIAMGVIPAVNEWSNLNPNL